MLQKSDKTQLIVIGNHALAHVFPGTLIAEVLHASGLKNSPLHHLDTFVIDKHDKVRLASKQDFIDFNVSFKGYENKDEYEYAETRFEKIVNGLNKSNIRHEVQEQDHRTLLGVMMHDWVWDWFEIKHDLLFFHHTYSQNTGKTKKGMMHGVKRIAMLEKIVGNLR